jgi:hypothetical protein
MQVKSLEKMEKIVSRNRYLKWDGWTVLNAFPSDRGSTSKDGVLINGKWHIQNRYEPNENGWNIPDKLVR